MYQPAGVNPLEEYIELFNRGTGTVNLAGWRISKGVDFTFPSINLPSGGYLVVASHLPSFQAKYPGVLNVIGGWNTGFTTNFVLSNGGEEIELVDAAGDAQDSVNYANEGDWGLRQLGPPLSGTRGWEWYAEHDALGKSLELINANLSNNHGQNWAASVTQNGTPGVVNSASASDIPPVILEVTHYPPIPRSTDPVTISARLLDELTNGLAATLRYRNHSTTSPAAFSSTNMFDDGLHSDGLAGDGVFAAVLPAMANGTVIEFFVQATDAGSNTRTWPAPALGTNSAGDPTLGQFANAMYQVDDTSDTGTQPVFRLVLSETERLIFQNINRNSDAQMNTTFVSVDGTGTKVRYLCGTRIRGAGSRSMTPPPNRVNIPQDNPWAGVTELNINPQFVHAQLAGAFLAQKAGMVAANATAVQKRINGSGGAFVWVEPLGGEWAEHHLPNDGGGNVYRASTGSHVADLSHGTDSSYFIGRGYSKASNSAENDWTDLIGLTDALNNSSDAAFEQQVNQHANMDSWMRYFAFMTMVASMETSIANGRGDDYSMYRGVIDPRFILLPHDLDTVLGEGDWGNDTTSANASIFRMVPSANAQVSGFGAPNVAILDRVFTNSTYAAIYYRELWRMLNGAFAPEQFNPLLSSLLSDMVAQNVIDRMITYQSNRNASVRSQIPLALTVSNLPPLVSGYPQTTSATIALNGGACPLNTLSVRVNGAPADWLTWRAVWAIPSVTLTPGLNRVLVQAFGSNNVEVARTTVDIWYDDGTVANRSGTLAGNVTWTAAGGPHNVTADVFVPAGAALTIQPGASVFFAPGTRLRIEGTLNASGTETARIRFGRTPGVAGSWNGILISNAASACSFAYVDFDGADAGTENLRIVDSDVTLSHCSWTNTTRNIIEFSNASLILSNSVLPSLTAAEHIHGGPILSGGYCVIVGNTFGGTTGLNDIIDIKGAQRPDAVLQVLNNVFTSASDDVLDLDGTDAHVEGNVFMNVHKNNAGVGDTACALALGQNAGFASHVVAVRNLFYDVDYVALAMEGAWITMVNNTAVGVGIAAVNFSEPERNTTPGLGARLDGNIFFNPSGYSGTNFGNRFPTNGTVQLSLARNIFAATDSVTNGVDGSLLTNPRLVNTPSVAATNILASFGLRPGSPGLASGPNGLDRGALVAAGASISGEPLSPTHLATATLTVAGPGISNYIYRVDGGAWSSERPITQTIALSGLANGAHTIEVRGRNSAGVLQDSPGAAVSWTVDSSLVSLVLSEVLARNSATLLVEGETPDLVEFQNRGGTVLDLGGMGVTDDPSDPYKYSFPPDTIVEPGDFIVLYADGGAGAAYLGFGFDADGDALYLFNSPGAGGALVDFVNFGPQLLDRSIGRMRDGSWALNTPTFGAANVAAATGDPRVLKINEWLTDALTAYPADFLEVFNPDSLPVDLGGLYLTDQVSGTPNLHQIVPLSFVAAGGHVVFRADGEGADGGVHLNFRLAAERGGIALVGPDLSVIDCIFYEPQFTDIAQGRRPSGGSVIDYLSTPTPGAANPGLSGTTTVSNFTTTITFLRLSNDWRYEASGTNLGTGWRASGYDDSGWVSGPGLLGFEAAGTYAEPLRTPLPTNTVFNTLQVTSYYFRTTFTLTNDVTGFLLSGTANVDDGCVIYVNGSEVHRIRMGGGTVTANTFAQNTQDGTTDTFTLPVSSLVQGNNVVAVEVHQASFNSSDMVFGLGLSATRTISTTNATGIALVLNELLASPGTVTNADGTITDWAEIYNPTTNAVSLADMSLSDSTTDPRRWVFPTGASIAAGGTLVVRFDSAAAASTNNGATLNTGFGLNNNGDALYLFDNTANGGALLDSVVFGIQASEFSIGRVPNGSGAWQLTQPSRGTPNVAASLSGLAGLTINEWMADPDNSEDDWFEIWNPNPAPVSIGGLFLTDDSADRTRSPIPPLSFIGVITNGYARFVADSAPENGPDHVDFRLSNDGDFIGLYPAGTGPAIAGVTFGPQVNKVSEGRFPDGSATIVPFPDTASPAAANFLALCDITINEALTHTDPPFEDAIELQNLTSSEIDVSGWYLSDTDNDYRKFRIPDGTIIAPGGFKVFYETNFNSEPGLSTSFSLSSAQGDQIHLSTADTNGILTGYRTSVKFGAAQNGESFGRYETSDGLDFTAMSARSFGQDNPANVAQFRTGTGLTNPAPRVGPVVVTEVMYHPPDIGTNDNTIDEFIELQNIAATNVALFHPGFPTNFWRLRDAVDFRFPSNITMAAGSRLLIVSFSPTNAALSNAFRVKYSVPAGVRLFGPWSGKLDNSSDSVELARPDAPQVPPSPDAGMVPFILVDKVKYGDSTPWPSLPDGSTNGIGYSLQRRVNANYGNDPVNWLAGVPTAGAATGAAAQTLPSITAQPANTVVTEGASATFNVTAAGAAPLSYQWRMNGKPILDATNASLTVTSVEPADEGRYAVLVSNPAGAVSSVEARLLIQGLPGIITEPQSQVVLAGTTATFTVVAGGSAPLRYQWFKDGSSLGGQTNTSLAIPNAQDINEGGYHVVVTNQFGSATSVVATLTINVPPSITQQPQSLIVNAGDTATFTVMASGDGPLRYQWRFNGGNIAGETNDTLTIVNAQGGSAGSYSVRITNSVGNVTSGSAILTVVLPPVVTVSAPDPAAAESGANTGTFFVTRSYITNTPLTVNFTLGGTAAAGDYAPISSPVTIPANLGFAPVTVTPVDDTELELPETVILTVQNGAGYAVGGASSTNVTIADNDNLLPSVALTAPTNGQFFITAPTNVLLTASAADTDGTVVRVEFFRNGLKLGEDTDAPFAFTWTNAPFGSNVLTAIATDDFGGATTSAPVSIVLNSPPSVNITAPNNGASFTAPANINITASAADTDGTVTQVEFFEGANFLGVDTSSPYAFSWTSVPIGSYTLTARATDNSGAERVSASVAISVSEVVPVFFNNFSNRVTVTGAALTVTGSNAGYGIESTLNEPTQGGQVSRSGWMAWTAPAAGLVVMDTFGSTSINTTLAAYTGVVLGSLTTVAYNDNAPASILSQITFNAVAGTTYHVQVGGRTGSGDTAGNIVLHIAYSNSPPSIAVQPQSQSVMVGANVAFSVTAGGTTPLSYRWRKNGNTIPGAAAASYTLNNVVLTNEGAYSVVVTNLYGAITSAVATLTVDDGLVVTYTKRLLELSNSWSYEQSGADLGTAWRMPDFDDLAWPVGAGLLGFDTTPGIYPEPFRTSLSLSNAGVATATFYFRTGFLITNDAFSAVITATNYLDDGAVWHLNGSELARVRLPLGPITYTTQATNQNSEGTPDVWIASAAPLVSGENILAVEVHQGQLPSSDVVFGMSLDATITYTNRPTIINVQMLANGSFQGTLVGIAGRRYAVDFTPSLGGAWTTLTNFNTFTGQADFTDPAPAVTSPRFYRGRLVP